MLLPKFLKDSHGQNDYNSIKNHTYYGYCNIQNGLTGNGDCDQPDQKMDLAGSSALYDMSKFFIISAQFGVNSG